MKKIQITKKKHMMMAGAIAKLSDQRTALPATQSL